MRRRRWGFRGIERMSGGAATSPRALVVSRTVRHALTTARPRSSDAWSTRWCPCVRRNRGLGPVRIAGITGLHASTTHRALVRHGLNRLDHLDRLTRKPIRRCVMSRPGELVHVDIKKLERIPKVEVGPTTGGPKSTTAGGPKSATPTSTRRSTALAGWPTQRPSPTSKARPPPPFGSGRHAFSGTKESPSSECSATTGAAIAPRPSPLRWVGSNTPSRTRFRLSSPSDTGVELRKPTFGAINASNLASSSADGATTVAPPFPCSCPGAWRQMRSAGDSSLGPQQQRGRRAGRDTSRNGSDQVAEPQGTESDGHHRQCGYGRPGHDVDVGGEEIP